MLSPPLFLYGRATTSRRANQLKRNEMEWNNNHSFNFTGLLVGNQRAELTSQWELRSRDSPSKVSLFWILSKGASLRFVEHSVRVESGAKIWIMACITSNCFTLSLKRGWLTTGSLTDLSRLLGAETLPTTKRETAATNQHSFELAKGTSLSLSWSPSKHMERQ